MTTMEYYNMMKSIDRVSKKYLTWEGARSRGDYPLTGKRREGFELAVEVIKSALHRQFSNTLE